MANRFEQNPYNEIVDIETFSIWAKDYRRYLLADPSVKRNFASAPDDRDIPAEDRIVGYEFLSFNELAWNKIPESIQEIISIQHESVKDATVDKAVTIEFDVNELEFNVHSSLIKNERGNRALDLVGETYSMSGVKLIYSNSEDSIGQKGIWWIDRSLPSAKQIGNDVFNNWWEKGGKLSDHGLDRFLASLRPEAIPVTLNQLHDVASLLINGKPNAVITKLIPEVPRNN